MLARCHCISKCSSGTAEPAPTPAGHFPETAGWSTLWSSVGISMQIVLAGLSLQDPLSLPLPWQQALAEVLVAVAAPLQLNAGYGGKSAAAINWAAGGLLPDTSALEPLPAASLASIPLLPLLHMVSGSPSAGVSAYLCTHQLQPASSSWGFIDSSE